MLHRAIGVCVLLLLGGLTVRGVLRHAPPTLHGELVERLTGTIAARAEGHQGTGSGGGAFLPFTQGAAFRHNVRAALGANGGALRAVTIAPGATWSFNRTVGNPDLLALQTYIVLGGGWCDLASRYVVALRPLLPPEAIRFPRHAGGISGVDNDNAVAIWNTNDTGGEQDLLVTNTTDRTILLTATDDASGVTISATWGQP